MPTASLEKDLKVVPVSPDVITAEPSELAGEPSRRRPMSLIVRTIRGFFQVLLPLAVLAGGFGVYQYLKATKPEAPKRTARPTVFAISTSTVTLTNVRPELRLFGTTVAGRRVEIRSLVAGKVVSTSDSLRDGGTIQQGQKILTIDPFNFKADLAENQAQLSETKAKIAEFRASIASERSSLKFAREQAAIAKTDFERAQPLSRRGAVSRRTVDDRRLTLSQRQQAISTIENNINVWQARLAQQEAAIKRLETARERAQQRLAETELKAPFNAYVTDVGAQVGRMVSVNDRVATLIDADWIEVSFTVRDRQFGRLARGEGIEGREVEVRWNVGNKPIIYQAKIDRVGASVSSEAGGVQVYARVKKPTEGVGLRPGAFVELRVPDTKFERVARLPSTAVFNRDTVYVVEDGKLTARKVAIVGTSGADVLLRGEIKPGDKVMTTRLSLPGDGVRVREIAAKSKSDGAPNVN